MNSLFKNLSACIACISDCCGKLRSQRMLEGIVSANDMPDGKHHYVRVTT